jgi:hypothetical protein
VELSAIRATAAPVGSFSLLAVFVYVADEYPAIYAGAWTLEASVMGLYGVVIVVVGVYPRCVHKSSLWTGLRGATNTCGAIPLSDALILAVFVSVFNLFCCFLVPV